MKEIRKQQLKEKMKKNDDDDKMETDERKSEVRSESKSGEKISVIICQKRAKKRTVGQFFYFCCRFND